MGYFRKLVWRRLRAGGLLDWSAAAGTPPPGYTFARTGTAYDLAGASLAAALVASFATGTPRFGWDTNSALYGMLIEGARTDINIDSDMTSANWTRPGGTVVVQGASAPDGGNAYLLTAGGTLQADVRKSRTTTNGTVYATGIFAKAGSAGFLQINAFDTASRYAAFNLSTGAVGSKTAGVTAGTIKFPNGWWYCWVSIATASTTTFSIIRATDADDGSGGDACANGHAILLWEPGVEAAAFGSSPIVTSGSTVTRNAETCIRTGLVVPSTGETVLIKGVAAPGVSGTQTFYRQDDNTDAEYVRFSINSSGHGIWDVVTGSGSVASLDVGAIAAGASFSTAARIVANDFAASLGGAACATDASGTLPVAMTNERLGHGRSGNECFGRIVKAPMSAKLRRKPLINSDLQALAAAA